MKITFLDNFFIIGVTFFPFLIPISFGIDESVFEYIFKVRFHSYRYKVKAVG